MKSAILCVPYDRGICKIMVFFARQPMALFLRSWYLQDHRFREPRVYNKYSRGSCFPAYLQKPQLYRKHTRTNKAALRHTLCERVTNDKTARRQQRQTMRRHGNLLGGRCLGEKRRKRWKRCKEWRCEKRQWAFYKERTSRRSASLASPSAPSAPSAPHARRTHTTTGSSPPG